MQFVTPKEDAEQRPAAGKPSLASTASSSSSSWLRSKDPRIVRVSRAFGGKDRHSKVCTIRGLRDRRVRLSVPTAIQLYDLQERLGLDQPSKVVDWLLNAAKDEIEELPPLPVSPENFSMFNYHRYHLNLLNPSAYVHEKDDEDKEEDRLTTTTTTTRNYDFLAPIGSYYPSTGFQTADLVPFPSQILMCPATISTTTTTSATSIAQNPFASGPSNAEMREIPRQIMINRFQSLNADSNSQINPSLYSLNQTNNVGGDGNSVRFPFEFSMGAPARVLHSAGSSSGSRGNEFHSK